MRDNSRDAVAERRRKWRERLQGELTRMMGLLRQRRDVRKVILFGSMARGSAGARSDLDLVIVQGSDRRFLDRIGDFYDYLTPHVETDILAYTPREWEELRTTSRFQRTVDDEGFVLYDAHPSPGV